MQQLMKLLERDHYIYWHRLKDEDVVCDIFWSHPDAVKLTHACNLVFLIDSTYKTICYDKCLPARLGEHMSFCIAQSHLLLLVYWLQATQLTSQQLPLHQ